MEVSPQTLSDELWLRVFTYFTLEDLDTCALVCAQWKAFANDFQLFKPVDDLKPLLDNETILWRQIHHFTGLTDLFEKVFEDQGRHSLQIRIENTLHAYVDPYIRKGNDSFSITNNTDIKYKRKKGSEITFKSKKRSALTHLAVDGHYLFSLDIDGMMTFWDYKKKTCIRSIQTTETSASKKILFRNGHIVLNYGMGGWELIPDAMSEQVTRHWYPFESSSEYFFKIIGHKLYACAKEHILIKNFNNLFNGKYILLEHDPSLKVQDIAVNQGIICTSDGKATITLYHEESGRIIKRHHFNMLKSSERPAIQWMHHVVLHNLFIAYGKLETGHERVTIVDLNHFKIVGGIEGLFDFETGSLNPKQLVSLVQCCKKHFATLNVEMSGASTEFMQ